MSMPGSSSYVAYAIVAALSFSLALFIFRRLYVGVIFLIIASTMNGFLLPLAIGGLTLDLRPDQLILIPLLVLLLFAFLSRQARFFRTELDLPIIGLVSANLLSSIMGYTSSKSISYQGVALLSVYTAMYFTTVNALMQYSSKRTKLHLIVKVFLLLGVAHAVYSCMAMISYGLGVNIGGIQWGQFESSVSVRSTFYEANLLGIYLCIIGLSLMVFLIQGRFHHWNRWLVLSLVLVCLALTLTLTRSAWGTFFLGVVFILLLTLFKRSTPGRLRLSMVWMIAGLLIALTVSMSILNPLLSRLSGQRGILVLRVQRMLNLSDSSVVGRWLVYERGWERWLQSPIWGYGTFSGQSVGIKWFNSSIIQTLHDTGIVGLFFLGWMYLATVVVTWREYRACKQPSLRCSLLAFLLGNLVLFVTSQTSSFLWVGFPWVYMGLTIALVHASRRQRANRL